MNDEGIHLTIEDDIEELFYSNETMAMLRTYWNNKQDQIEPWLDDDNSHAYNEQLENTIRRLIANDSKRIREEEEDVDILYKKSKRYPEFVLEAFSSSV
jgi:hypothetical protein